MRHAAALSHRLRKPSSFLLAIASAVVLLFVVGSASAGSLHVSTLAPLNGQTVSGRITWSVSVSPQGYDHIVFAIDGADRYTAPRGVFTYNGPGGTLDTTSLPNGSHTLTATAYSSRGAARDSSSVVVTVANGAAPSAPVNTAAPTVSGTPTVGEALTASNGTWSGTSPITYAYSWSRCNNSGGSCSTISGAGSATYTLVAADAGATLRASVTATNTAASAIATSAPTPVIAAGAGSGTGTTTTGTTTTGTTTTGTTTTGTTTTGTTTTGTTTTTPAPAPGLGTKLPARMPESSGSTVYVSPSGSDSNNGSLSSPWRTLQKAFSVVGSGAVIDLRGGTYAGEVVLQNRSFSASNPVTIQSYPGETATFTGDSTKECYPAIYLWNTVGVRFRGLKVSNGYGNGYKIDSSAHIEIDRNVITNNGCQGILVTGNGTSGRTYSSDVQIWNSTFSHNGGYFTGNEPYALRGDHSMYLGGGAMDSVQHGLVGGVVANNVIYDQHTGYGIELGHSAWNVIVTNNTIDHTYQSCCSQAAGNAIEIFNDGASYYPSQGNLIVNNLLTNSYARGVYGACGSSMPSNVVWNNLGYGNGMATYEPKWGTSCVLYTLGSNPADANPLYVDRAGHNYHLQAGSPALGHGDPAYAPRYDADGKARPAAPAIGAFG